MWNDRFQMMRLLAPDTGGAPAASEEVVTPAPEPAAPDPAAPATPEPAPVTDAPKPDAAEAPASTSLIGDAEAPKEPTDKPADGEAAKPEAPKEGDKPKEEPEKQEPKKDEKDEPAADAAKPDEAAVAPVALTLADVALPDAIKLGDKESKAFFDVLNDAKLEPKQRAQGLIDLYLGEMKRIGDEADARQRTAWDNYNVQRKSEVKADTEVGGNRMNTALSMAKAVVEEYGGSAEQRAELFRRLDEKTGTGMGNDVFLIRLLNNIGRKLNVFEDGIIPANPTAPKATRTPGKRGWYDGPNGASA